MYIYVYMYVDQYLSKWYEDIQVHLHNMNIKHNLYFCEKLFQTSYNWTYMYTMYCTRVIPY